MANIELLEQVMTHIKDHPEKHQQETWIGANSCGTTGCFAGWAVMLTLGRELSNAILYLNTDEVTPEERKILGNKYNVMDAAQYLLDLSDEEADALFLATNSVEDLELLVKDLANGERIYPYKHNNLLD